jgi:hypothetical protein
MKFPTLTITWPERFLRDVIRADKEGFQVIRIPEWRRLEEEEAATREAIASGRYKWPDPEFSTLPWLFQVKSAFNINFIQHFFGLRSVLNTLLHHAKKYSEERDALKVKGINLGQSVRETILVNLYGMYSMSRWNHFGKKVFVVDPDTFELLANTELPKMPAKYLKGPYPTFWVEFPPNSYKFDVPMFGNQTVAGVMVSFSETEPGGERYLTMVVGGNSDSGAYFEDAMVYFNEALDERPVCDIYRDPEETGLITGGYEIGTLTPRAVLNLCLYLMQEHPALRPVPAIERRTFGDIKSPKQKIAALKNQADRLKNISKLGYVYVGTPFVSGAIPSENRQRSWVLDKEVWVSGHWKFQPHGPKNSLRKLLHIQPYWKGSDKKSEVPSVARVRSAQEVRDEQH